MGNIDLDGLDALSPDTEEHETVFAALAGDCVAALIYSIEAAEPGGWQKLKRVQQVIDNSLYQYLSALNDPVPGTHAADPTFTEQITTMPLWRGEAALQQMDFDALRGQVSIPPSVVNELRGRSAKAGIQPRLRGLIC